MATIQLNLKSRKKQDNTYPIIIRIRHDRAYFDIPTGESIFKIKFDRNKAIVLGNPSLVAVIKVIVIIQILIGKLLFSITVPLLILVLNPQLAH